ncbi:MAG: hypothetical protein CM15mP74_26400 [Halieaceae bacterium]|nr:MAG: hypothetical protein CM15mP74_26400 [Halieaceae bacterium]
MNRRLLVIDGGQLSVGAGAKMPTGKAPTGWAVAPLTITP